MNGAEESRGMHGVKMERPRELLDSEIEILRGFYSVRGRRREREGRQKEPFCGEMSTTTQMEQCSHSIYTCSGTIYMC